MVTRSAAARVRTPRTAACAITSMRTSISTTVHVAAELGPAPTRYTPRSLHSVGNVENLTLTGAAAIDGTGNANVITGFGTDCPGFAGINTLIGGGNGTLGSARRWSAPVARPFLSERLLRPGTSEVPIRLGCQCAVDADRFLAPRVRQGVGGRWDGCR